MKYSITKEDFTVTLTVNTNTGSCYTETQFIMVIKREKLDFLLKKKINESILCDSVSAVGVEREQAQRSLKLQQAPAV